MCKYVLKLQGAWLYKQSGHIIYAGACKCQYVLQLRLNNGYKISKACLAGGSYVSQLNITFITLVASSRNIASASHHYHIRTIQKGMFTVFKDLMPFKDIWLQNYMSMDTCDTEYYMTITTDRGITSFFHIPSHSLGPPFSLQVSSDALA